MMETGHPGIAIKERLLALVKPHFEDLTRYPPQIIEKDGKTKIDDDRTIIVMPGLDVELESS